MCFKFLILYADVFFIFIISSRNNKSKMSVFKCHYQITLDFSLENILLESQRDTLKLGNFGQWFKTKWC